MTRTTCSDIKKIMYFATIYFCVSCGTHNNDNTIISLCHIKGPVFVMGTGCVLCELQTEF